MRTKPTSYFTNEEVEYSYPDGLTIPLVYGLRELMKIDRNGYIVWDQDPEKFLDKNLSNIIKKYRVIIDSFNFYPQKVGRNEGYYAKEGLLNTTFMDTFGPDSGGQKCSKTRLSFYVR
jgi:hypothetical protein